MRHSESQRAHTENIIPHLYFHYRKESEHVCGILYRRP